MENVIIWSTMILARGSLWFESDFLAMFFKAQKKSWAKASVNKY